MSFRNNTGAKDGNLYKQNLLFIYSYENESRLFLVFYTCLIKHLLSKIKKNEKLSYRNNIGAKDGNLYQIIYL